MINLPLVNLWKNRSLVLYYSVLTLKTRFKGTYLGLFWIGIEPLLTFLMLFVVFDTIRIGREENFAMYLLSGILLFHIFTRGTILGMGSLRNNKSLLQSIFIRREFFPVAYVGTVAISSIAEVIILLSLMPVFEFTPSWTIVFLPLVILLLLALTLGFSYLLSIALVYRKDMQWTWPIIAHAAFFLTPIFWYLDAVPNTALLTIHSFNPVGQIIELGHKLIIFGEIPPIQDWIYATMFVTAILFLGYAVFQKFESKIVEEL